MTIENMWLTKKTCTKCNQEKILLDFSPKRAVCKACTNAEQKAKRSKMGSDPAYGWRNFDMWNVTKFQAKTREGRYEA
jgi:hypothetical protein